MLACRGDFLVIPAQGQLDEQVLATPEGLDALLIGAYAMLDGVAAEGGFGWESAASNWLYGSVRGLEANPGSDAGDSSTMPAVYAAVHVDPVDLWLPIPQREIDLSQGRLTQNR
ncbi:MAG: hypothetical protein D6722_12815 [Bacteroidetes bacterium]|nr:MAG: hypothetical protein D6722_12815 [Bacteroidota bacterium]